MKRLFTGIAIIGLMAALPAMADDHHDHHDQGHQQAAPGGGHQGGGGGGGAMRMSAPQEHHEMQGAMRMSAPQEHHEMQGGMRMEAPQEHREMQGGPEHFAEQHRDNGGFDDHHHDSWQSHDGGHGWNGHEWHDMHAPHAFHYGEYREPPGWHYHRWEHGEYLPRDYFDRPYWIFNFEEFGLFAPPPDLMWVRVGDDAVLVDRYSGEVVQVEYGIFY